MRRRPRSRSFAACSRTRAGSPPHTSAARRTRPPAGRTSAFRRSRWRGCGRSPSSRVWSSRTGSGSSPCATRPPRPWWSTRGGRCLRSRRWPGPRRNRCWRPGRPCRRLHVTYADPGTVVELGDIIDSLNGRLYALGELRVEAIRTLLRSGTPSRTVAAYGQIPPSEVEALRPAPGPRIVNPWLEDLTVPARRSDARRRDQSPPRRAQPPHLTPASG